MLEKVRSIYKIWIPIQRNLRKGERYGIGQKIDQLLIDTLELLHRASFSSLEAKINLLGDVLVKIDSLRFFIQLSWELKLIPTGQFTHLGSEVESAGRMVGGWPKGLLTKTSARVLAEEKK